MPVWVRLFEIFTYLGRSHGCKREKDVDGQRWLSLDRIGGLSRALADSGILNIWEYTYWNARSSDFDLGIIYSRIRSRSPNEPDRPRSRSLSLP